jgi:hypothetical protein
MVAEEIRRVRLAQPFSLFTLEMDDGRLLPVTRPYYLAISPNGRELTYASADRGFEHFSPSRVVRIHPGLLAVPRVE